MPEWIPIYQVAELKSLLQGEWQIIVYHFYVESTNEITPDVQKELQALSKQDQEEKQPSNQLKDEQIKSIEASDDNDLYYFNKEENVYKVFDPEQKKWLS